MRHTLGISGIVLLSGLFLCLYAQNAPLYFDHISIEQGLSHRVVYASLQDKNGFMWFATEGGLNRYDGYQFVVYQSDPRVPNSLAYINISAMQEDSGGSIWLATWGGGLDEFDPRTEHFTHYQFNPKNPNTISDNRIQSLYTDHEGVLWVGTLAGGLNKLIRDASGQGQFKVYKNDPQNVTSLSSNRVWSIAEDGENNLWIGTEEGLNKFDRQTETFTRFFSVPNQIGTINHNRVRSLFRDHAGHVWIGTQEGFALYNMQTKLISRLVSHATDSVKKSIINRISEDHTGRIWIGTQENGLYIYDLTKNEVQRYVNNPLDPASLSSNDIRSLSEDRAHNMWIGTRGGGINKVDLKGRKFSHYKHDVLSPNSLTNDQVYAFYEDEKGLIWIGTDGGGVNVYDPATRRYTSYYNRSPELTTNPIYNRIRVITKDREGIMWIGTYGGGIAKFDPNKKQFVGTLFDPRNSSNLNQGRVWCLYEDHAGNMWIGSDGGVAIVPAGSDHPITYKHEERDSTSLSHNDVVSMLEDRDGNMWLGTWGGGLDRVIFSKGPLSLDALKFTSYQYDPFNVNSISNNLVLCFYQDRSGMIWLGTGGGLNVLDPMTGNFTHYFSADGLPHNTVQSILPDDEGNLWLSTLRGLSKMDTKTPGAGTKTKFRNYDILDGVQSNEFNRGAAMRTRKGEMFFGGVNGYNTFFPAEVKDHAFIPPVVLVAFKKFDRLFAFPQAIYFIPEITIPATDNFFSFEFAALDYTNPQKNQYAYKLEGFDTDWNYSGTRRYASYTNLEGGRYIFRVKGTNSDGLWNEEGVSVRVTITPPFWKTLWFRFLAAATVILLAGFGYKYRVRNIQIQKGVLEKEVAGRTAQLEKINTIVQSINSEMSFDDLLQSILNETRYIAGVERATILLWDQQKEVFRYRARTGWNADDFAGIELTSEEAEKRYTHHAKQIFENIFVVRDIPRLAAEEKFRHLPVPKSLLVMRMPIEKRQEGYVIFHNMHDENAFENQDIRLLNNLKEHIISAVIKTRILEELKLLNEKKNEFLGIAAHDLRNPLSTITLCADLTLETIEDNNFDLEQCKKDLQQISRVSRHMANLLTELLDYSSIESGKVRLDLHKENLSAIIEECEKLHKRSAEQKQIELVFEGNEFLSTVLVDRSKISTVIDNLMTNAIKYTYPGGKVRVYCESGPANNVITHIEDTGQGLSEDDLEKVFTTFKKLSARPTGGESSTGLGLAIVKKIVEMHKGRVWVESQQGKGSRFSFSLPVEN
jgi:signal transduction histidine kinase/ligand-binding sensor domain-containing protein